MTIEEEVTQNKNKLSIKTMYFNRFLLVRYVTAGFFFMNLNWLVLMVYNKNLFFFIPLVLTVLIVLSMGEHVKLYQSHKNELPLTKIYYKVQLGVNVMLICLVISPFFKKVFYFMSDGLKGKLMTVSFLLIGLVLTVIIQRKLFKINHNQDKHYDRIKRYEKLLSV